MPNEKKKQLNKNECFVLKIWKKVAFFNYFGILTATAISSIWILKYFAWRTMGSHWGK